MIMNINVNFSKSRANSISRLPSPIPQLFNAATMEPIRIANNYLRSHARRWAPNSLRTNAEHLKNFFSWIQLYGIDVRVCTVRHLELYADSLCSQLTKAGISLAWSTIDARVKGIHYFLKWSMQNGSCLAYQARSGNGLTNILPQKFRAIGHPAKQIRSLIPFLRLDEANRFISALKDSLEESKPNFIGRRNALMARLMLEVGMRVSEVIEFPMADVPFADLKNISTGARIVGKGKKQRMVIIPNDLLLDIWDYADLNRERILDALPPLRRTEATSLFLTISGTAVSRNWVEKVFAKTGKRVGIACHPHTLRHTFGTYHYLKHRDLPLLSQLMGHASLETTAEHYLHTAALTSETGNYRSFQENFDSRFGRK